MRAIAFIFFAISVVGFESFAQSPSPSATPVVTTTTTISPRKCCMCIYYDEAPAETSKFKTQCDNWLNLQTGCAEKESIPRKESGMTSSYPTGCTEAVVEYKGHGTGCGDIPVQTGACLGASPNCTLYKYHSTGCSVFDDKAKADATAAAIQLLLPAGCKASVTANQCNVIANISGIGEFCTSKMRYIITESGITCRYGSCDPVGVHCDPSSGGTIKTCAKLTGITTQRCCNVNGFGMWIETGKDCPPLPTTTTVAPSPSPSAAR